MKRLPFPKYQMQTLTLNMENGHPFITLAEGTFLLDTGASVNFITPDAAREVTSVSGDSRAVVHGISGSVKNVYRADQATLQFANLRQKNQDILAFDMTHISDNTGTEISGTLGFSTLRVLDIKIDYRDGLVDFIYDPNSIPVGRR